MTEKYTYQKINSLMSDPQNFISECNRNYHSGINGVARVISDDKNKKIVLLAGPSSSGKTTTAKILSEKIKELGGKAYTVSLDDFYFPKSVGYPLDENGKPDFECVEALDLELLHSKLNQLSEYGKASLPVFDFMTGERTDNAKNIELLENDIIIVEGLHALNPVITDTLDETRLMKIYISVSSRVYNDNGEVLLSKRDLRFIRRAVRDSRFRSTPVQRTFELWESVMRGEDRYLFPFKDRADIKINSFHPCEPCVFSQEAVSLLGKITEGEYAVKSKTLINKLVLFKNTDYSLLPADSLLKEFAG